MSEAWSHDGKPLIRLERFSKSYGKVRAVEDVSLDVHEGDFAAITGASGSGKTTLLGMVGLLETASDGTYTFKGRTVTQLADSEASKLRNQKFGFVFQQFHLLPELSAWENVARPLVYAGVAKRERKARALALLEKLGLAERANHRPAQLSGGEQQRVAIARALINDPDIILADEPTGNLPQAQWEPILELLEELNQQGKTVLIVSHEPQVADRARRKIVLQDGRVVAS